MLTKLLIALGSLGHLLSGQTMVDYVHQVKNKGLVATTDTVQTITGAKTFSGATTFSGAVTFSSTATFNGTVAGTHGQNVGTADTPSFAGLTLAFNTGSTSA